MSAPKFTPGPWQNHGRIDGAPGPKCSAVAANTLLARVFSTAFGDEENEKANADLMAAATELYEALDELVEQLEGEHFCFAKARAALAKARGES